LTTTLLTGGAAVLFLLWYITPRTMFEQQTGTDRPRDWIDSERSKP
jgi:hypothetical protein